MNYWEGTMDSLNVDYKTAAVGDLWPPAETLRDQWRPSAARQKKTKQGGLRPPARPPQADKVAIRIQRDTFRILRVLVGAFMEVLGL